MRAFEVHIDGEWKCVAGLEGFGSSGLIIHWMRREVDPPDIDPENIEQREIKISVGGGVGKGEDFEYRRWLLQELFVGAEVMVRVVEVAEASEPSYASSEATRKCARLEGDAPDGIDIDAFLFGPSEGKNTETIELGRRARASLYEMLKGEFEPEGE